MMIACFFHHASKLHSMRSHADSTFSVMPDGVSKQGAIWMLASMCGGALPLSWQGWREHEVQNGMPRWHTSSASRRKM
jgi:hypothetical protein